MSSNEFMGYLITAILALLTGAGTITAIIIRPILKLNGKITELDLTIKNLGAGPDSRIGKIEQRIGKHGEEIDNINKDLKDFEGRISKVEARKKLC